MSRFISDIIDEVGPGCAQFRVCLLAGHIFFVCGSFYVCALIFPSTIVAELGGSRVDVAMLGSSQFAGLLAGNLGSAVSDRLGRRPVILATTFGFISLVIASSFAATLWSIALLWCFAGLCLGICLPTYNALHTEISPTTWRSTLGACAQLLFPTGCLFGVFLVFVIASDMDGIARHWRWLLRASMAPSAFLFVLGVYPGFVESPSVLVGRGKKDEARKQLELICNQNNRPDVSPVFVTPPPKAGQQTQNVSSILFGGRQRAVTIVVALAFFRLNFGSTGAMFTLPYILGHVDVGCKKIMCLFFATSCMWLGHLASVGMERFPRRTLLQMSTLAEGVFVSILLIGVNRLEHDGRDIVGLVLLNIGIYGMNFVAPLAWTAMYTYATEVFPPAVSATGAGFCMALGRLGSLMAPFVFEGIVVTTGTYHGFFAMAVSMCALHFILIGAYLPETRGKSLEELSALMSPEERRRSSALTDAILKAEGSA